MFFSERRCFVALEPPLALASATNYAREPVQFLHKPTHCQAQVEYTGSAHIFGKMPDLATVEKSGSACWRASLSQATCLLVATLSDSKKSKVQIRKATMEHIKTLNEVGSKLVLDVSEIWTKFHTQLSSRCQNALQMQ